MCIIHTLITKIKGNCMQSSYVIDKLKQNGRILVRVKGSHHVFTHPDSPLTIVVPHPKKDLPIGTLKVIAKAAGIKL